LATLEIRLQELEASSRTSISMLCEPDLTRSFQARHELSLEDMAPYSLNSTDSTPPSCSPPSACTPPFAGVISPPISASSSWPAAFSVSGEPLQTEGLDGFDSCINFRAESNAVDRGPMNTFSDGAETYL
jgi:hypothetical protein